MFDFASSNLYKTNVAQSQITECLTKSRLHFTMGHSDGRLEFRYNKDLNFSVLYKSDVSSSNQYTSSLPFPHVSNPECICVSLVSNKTQV